LYSSYDGYFEYVKSGKNMLLMHENLWLIIISWCIWVFSLISYWGWYSSYCCWCCV